MRVLQPGLRPGGLDAGSALQTVVVSCQFRVTLHAQSARFIQKKNIKVINGKNAGKAAHISRTHVPKMEEVADGGENADISHGERASCQVISFYL